MKTKIGVIIIGLAMLLCLSVTKAKAEQRAGAITLSPMIGGYLFEGDQDLKNSPTYGLGLGYNFDENWSTEVMFNFIDSKERKRPHHGDVDGYMYHFDLLYHLFPSHSLVPYLAAGIGGRTLDYKGRGSDSDFMLNYGGGLKYFVTENIALRGDVRHVMTLPENNLVYTAGLTYYFGGEKKVEEKRPEQPKDSDGDGVYDKMDRCPNTPKGVKVDGMGCPLDTDGDGVYDYLDKCPDTPKGVKVDDAGCPLDTDGDGVYDYLDKCPDTPKGAKVNKVGCWIIKNLTFDTNKWNIKPEFFKDLENVVEVLKKNPDIRVEIQGHTDNIGSAKYNQILSAKRAKAVMEYLVKKGIDASRLTYAGYGFSKPVASNKTPEGRAQNRRVELHIIK